MNPALIESSGPSGKPPSHNHTTSALPSGLSETVTTTANAVSSSDYASTNINTSLLPIILTPILMFGLGGLYYLWRHFYKRRKAKQIAPSAEFRKYRRRSTPLADVERGGASEAAAVEGRLRYPPHNNGGEKLEGGNIDSPPSFAPGLFKDPIFEKGVAITMANQSGRS